MRLLVATVLVLLAFADSAHAGRAGWAAAGQMTFARGGQSATLLKDGTVLVAGGRGADGLALNRVEAFDPRTNTWEPRDRMWNRSFGHSATLLDDGRVLVTGGYRDNGQLPSTPTAAGELYEPSTDHWTLAHPPFSSAGATATKMPDGGVIFAGGGGDGGVFSGVVRFHPATGWTQLAGMTTARLGHAAALVDGGLVVSGGAGSPVNFLPSAERYVVADNEWVEAHNLGSGRRYHTATRLSSGQILVTGGEGETGSEASSRWFEQGLWMQRPPMAVARRSHRATLLPDGTVLVTGGTTAIGDTASVERYDPTRNVWRTEAAMNRPRSGHTATLLPEGRVLVIGGGDSSAEVWTPETSLSVAANVGFGDVQVGATSDPVTVPLTNSGASSLFVDKVTAGGDFTVVADSCSGAVVAPGGACALGMRFTPGATGARGGELRLEANTALGDHTIALGGTGAVAPVTPPAVVVPSPTPTPTVTPPAKPSAKVAIRFRSSFKLPPGISRASGCRGSVVLTLRRGKRKLAARTVRLDRRCRYGTTFTLARSKLGGAKVVEVQVRFKGNRRLGPVTVRYQRAVPA